MRRWWLHLMVGLVVVAGLVWWQLPNLLWLIPSRYVAAYVPEAVQALALTEQIETLPTAAAPIDISTLLSPTPPPQAPATQTPIPTSTPAAEVSPPASPTPPPPTATPIPFASAARLQPITHHFQTWNNCGPATLTMTLSYFGINQYQAQTASRLKPNPEDRNVSPQEMVAYTNDFTEVQAVTRANGDLDTVRRFLSHGIPVIIETGIDPPGSFSWMEWYGHYLLVVAYDDARQTMWVFDSWLGTTDEIPTFEDESGNVVAQANQQGDGRTLSYATFDRYWRQFNRTYIAVYRPEQEALVNEIIGEQAADETMWQAALARTVRELEQEPDDPFLWFNLGTNYTALGDYQRAATAFDKAREVGLPWRMLWYQFGPYEAYYQLGRYQEVIDLAHLTLDRRPYFEESFYYRGLALQALGDATAAQADFNRARDFNPNFAPAVQALAKMAP